MKQTLKSKWKEYCKTTDNPYSYMWYVIKYPNIGEKSTLNYKNLSVEERRKYHRDRRKKQLSPIDRIKKLREEQGIIIG